MPQEKGNAADAVHEVYGPLLEDVESISSALSHSVATFLEAQSLANIKNNYIYLTESEEFKSDVEKLNSLIVNYNNLLAALNSRINSIWTGVVRNHREEFEVRGEIDETYFAAYLLAEVDFDEDCVREIAKSFSECVVPKFNLPPKLQSKFKEFLVSEAIRELSQQIASLKNSQEVIALRQTYSILVTHCNYMKNGLMKKIKNPRTPWKYAGSAELIR
ncbi:MAG: hypothetical protein ACPL1Y_01860 [Thermoplasmata archaeon]